MATNSTWIDEWLGEVEVTDDQRGRLERAAQRINERYPDIDQSDDRLCALNAACQVILGDTTLEAEVEAYQSAQLAAVRAHAAQTGALIAEAQTEAQSDLLRRAGITKPTLYKAILR